MELDDALMVLLEVLKGVWEKLKETDKTLVIYPWKEASDHQALADARNLSESLLDVQQYFDRAIPRKLDGTAYVSVYLEHERPFREMHSNLNWWLEGKNCGWYYKALQ